MEGVSIIICSYNGAERLGPTLLHLALQKCSCPFEVIVMDNASTDKTADVANRELQKYSDKLSYSVLTENRSGKQFAIDTGMAASRFNYIIICDDDNWLSENYVDRVYSIFENNKSIAITGGAGSPVPEVSLPFWFQRFGGYYAVFGQADRSAYVNSVYGAGMAFRKNKYDEIGKFFTSFKLTGARGKNLLRGEDSELCLQFRLAGEKIWYDEELTFKHYIPQYRLTYGYLKQIIIGIAKSDVILKLYENAISSDDANISSLFWLKNAGYFLGRYVKYWIPYHVFPEKEAGNFGNRLLLIRWRKMGFEYIKYNFKIPKLYSEIFRAKSVFLSNKK